MTEAYTKYIDTTLTNIMQNYDVKKRNEFPKTNRVQPNNNALNYNDDVVNPPINLNDNHEPYSPITTSQVRGNNYLGELSLSDSHDSSSEAHNPYEPTTTTITDVAYLNSPTLKDNPLVLSRSTSLSIPTIPQQSTSSSPTNSDKQRSHASPSLHTSTDSNATNSSLHSSLESSSDNCTGISLSPYFSVTKSNCNLFIPPPFFFCSNR